MVLDLTEGSSDAPLPPVGTALLDPPDLAALLYRNARKQRRAEEGTAPRRAQAEETIALLEGVEARLAEIAARRRRCRRRLLLRLPREEEAGQRTPRGPPRPTSCCRSGTSSWPGAT